MAEENLHQSSKLGSLFDRVRERRSEGSRRPYDSEDVLAVLVLLARGYTLSDICHATFITLDTIRKWRNHLLAGTIDLLYPGLKAAAESFDESSVPEIPVLNPSRRRQTFKWQQRQLDIDAGVNPYDNPKPNGLITIDE